MSNTAEYNAQTPNPNTPEFKARKAAYFFYDKDVDRLNRDIESHNRGVIIVCRKCHKVDVHPIHHVTECNPAAERLRQESQEVYWK